MASAGTPLHLLRLPREIRDEIFTYALFDPEGYHHDAATNRLRKADGTKIDLTLRLVCKQIAAETQGLALRTNRVFFKVFCAELPQEQDDVWKKWPVAGRHDFLVDKLNFLREEAFTAAVACFATDDLAQQITDQFPMSQIGATMKRLLDLGQGEYVPMLAAVGCPKQFTYHDRQAIHYALGIMTQNGRRAGWAQQLRTYSQVLSILGHELPDVSEAVATCFMGPQDAKRLSGRVGYNYIRGNRPIEPAEMSLSRMASIARDVITMDVTPWRRPSEHQLSDPRALFSSDDPNDWKGFESVNTDLDSVKIRHHTSAVSQALSFIQSLSGDQRLQLRRLVLQEEVRSVAVPECHLQGLMPMLEESQTLRTERHIDVWNAILIAEHPMISFCLRLAMPEELWVRHLVLSAVYAFIPWLIEATNLPITDRCTTHFHAPFDTMQTIWNGVKTVAAICNAALVCHRKASIPFESEIDLILAFSKESNHECCDGEVLTRTIRQILSGKSGVNMPCMLGTLEEFEDETERILAQLEGCDVEAWNHYRQEALKGKLEPPEQGFEAIGAMYFDSSE